MEVAQAARAYEDRRRALALRPRARPEARTGGVVRPGPRRPPLTRPAPPDRSRPPRACPYLGSSISCRSSCGCSSPPCSLPRIASMTAALSSGYGGSTFQARSNVRVGVALVGAEHEGRTAQLLADRFRLEVDPLDELVVLRHAEHVEVERLLAPVELLEGEHAQVVDRELVEAVLLLRARFLVLRGRVELPHLLAPRFGLVVLPEREVRLDDLRAQLHVARGVRLDREPRVARLLEPAGQVLEQAEVVARVHVLRVERHGLLEVHDRLLAAAGLLERGAQPGSARRRSPARSRPPSGTPRAPWASGPCARAPSRAAATRRPCFGSSATARSSAAAALSPSE